MSVWLLVKSWIRAHTRRGPKGLIQVKAYYDKRSKKQEPISVRRKARVGTGGDAAREKHQELVKYAREIADSIRAIEGGDQGFIKTHLKGVDPTEAVANLKHQLKHKISEINQHGVDYRGKLTPEEKASGLHKKSGHLQDLPSGKALHASFSERGNHNDFKPEDHANAVLVHQGLAKQALKLKRDADAVHHTDQAKQHTDAVQHHGMQQTLHGMSAFEQKVEARRKKDRERKQVARAKAIEAREAKKVAEAPPPPPPPAAKTKKPKFEASGDKDISESSDKDIQDKINELGKKFKSSRSKTTKQDIEIELDRWGTELHKRRMDQFEQGAREDRKKNIDAGFVGTNYEKHKNKIHTDDFYSTSFKSQDVHASLRHLNMIPSELFDRIMGGHEIYIGHESVMKLDDAQKYLTSSPRGFKPGEGWDKAAGAYIPDARKMLIGYGGQDNAATHEFGHAVGKSFIIGDSGVVTSITERHHGFMSAYNNADKSKMRPYVKTISDGGVQETASAAMQEAFADCFGYTVQNEKHARSQFGDEMVDWMKNNVLGSKPAKTIKSKPDTAELGAVQSGAKQPGKPQPLTIKHLTDLYHEDLPSRNGLTSMPMHVTWKNYSNKVKAVGGTPDKAAFDRVILDARKKGQIEVTPHERPVSMTPEEKAGSVVVPSATWGDEYLHYWRPMS